MTRIGDKLRYGPIPYKLYLPMTKHLKIPATDNKAFQALWVISVPWAHPVWHSYSISLCDLTTNMGKKPVLLKKGVTHEIVVMALNPDFEIPEEITPGWVPQALTPPNHAYQFKAESDDDACKRIVDLVQRIENKTLNPDTDHISVWDQLFEDGVSLRKN